MTHDATPTRCTATDPFGPGRCPEFTIGESGLCGSHQAHPLQSRIVVDETMPDAPILAEMRWVACEARALMLFDANTDPDRFARFEERKRDLLDALREW